MSKTKYIKVNAADRLPEEEGCFLTDLGEFDFSDNEFKNEIQMPVNGIDWWLEEVPDKEEEIRGMLKKCLEALKTANFQLSKMNAVLLNELKSN